MFGAERIICFVYRLRKMILISRPREIRFQQIPTRRCAFSALDVVENWGSEAPMKAPSPSSID